MKICYICNIHNNVNDMKYSKIFYQDIVDGTGNRVSLFVSGCRNHCKGCFSEQTWDFNNGNEFTEIEENEILEACKFKYISGLSILGGDPMEEENQQGIVNLIKKFKKLYPKKTIWLYTGYVYERDLLEGQRKYIKDITDYILENVDVLVDGPFIEEKKDLSLSFRGSSNQRMLTKEDRMKLYENRPK